MIVLTVAYALSPVDLIPDFIPVPGYPDDLIVVPIGIALAVRMVPESMLDKYRKRAETELRDPGISRWAWLLIVPAIGCIVLQLTVKFLFRVL